jgi:hypothetical protein
MVLTCRFYEQKYPEIDDVVMVNVRLVFNKKLKNSNYFLAFSIFYVFLAETAALCVC